MILLRILPSWLGIQGIALCPFILIHKRYRKRPVPLYLISHERIHIRQQLEMLVIPFYIVYLLEYLIWYIRLRDWDKAYYRISLEREANAGEHDPEYHRHRKLFAWIKYFRIFAFHH